MSEFPKVPAGQPTWARVRHGGGCEVWRVPAGAWSPGDVVEIGPLPAGVRVEYDLARPYVAPFPAVAADDVEVVSA